MASITAPLIAETLAITYRDVRNGSNVANPIPHLPLPSQYVSVAIIYGGLSLFPDSAQQLATVMAWGFVVATLLNLWQPGATVNNAKQGATS